MVNYSLSGTMLHSINSKQAPYPLITVIATLNQAYHRLYDIL